MKNSNVSHPAMVEHNKIWTTIYRKNQAKASQYNNFVVDMMERGIKDAQTIMVILASKVMRTNRPIR